MNLDRELAMRSGRRCILRSRPLPWLPTYHVLFFPSEQGELTQHEEREMFGLAQRAASDLGQRFHGDPGCYAILFSGRCTRRRPWPHFHILAVKDVSAKRRALLLLYMRRVLILLDRARGYAEGPLSGWRHA